MQEPTDIVKPHHHPNYLASISSALNVEEAWLSEHGCQAATPRDAKTYKSGVLNHS
jgi:hypothetical protein